MSSHDVIQLREDIKWHVTELNGYEPVTNYWVRSIKGVNMALMLEAVRGEEAPQLLVGLRIWASGYPTETPEQWAELVMSMNHILWMLYGQDGGPKQTQETQKALSDLYYELHDKALDTLKGEALSKYLSITD